MDVAGGPALDGRIMPAENRAKLFQRTYPILKKHYRAAAPRAKRPLLEHLLLAICAENTTLEAAEAAFEKLKQSFFDLNELRVSSVEEIAGCVAALPEAEDKAARIRSTLQKVFETSYSFDLEALRKQPHKVVSKQLLKIPGVNDHALACTIQQGMEGHAQPVDGAIRRTLERLGLAEREVPLEALRGRLERLVPKRLGAEFTALVRELAADVCWEGEPACKDCPVREICPTGQPKLREGTAKSKSTLVKAAAAAKKAARAETAARVKARGDQRGRRQRASAVGAARRKKQRT